MLIRNFLIGKHKAILVLTLYLYTWFILNYYQRVRYLTGARVWL
jgi:hypothetical protein